MDLKHGHDQRAPARLIPERIKEAREVRGLTVEAFADHLNVTRQAVAQYETGQIAPSGEVLARIIALTALPPSFFVTQRERTRHGTPFWRGLKRMEQPHRRRISRRLEWARDITVYLEHFIQVPVVNFPTIEFNAETDDTDQIEIAAETLRDFWRLGRGPIRDLPLTLEKNGIVLVHEAVNCADMDAVSCWLDGRPFVLFSAQVLSGPRSLYNLAHELAHITLHAGVEVTTKNLDRIEKQANRFAGAFLLPRETFSQEILGNSIGYFKALKQRWGVAISAMAYRCKDLKILSANQYAYLLKQMNALKIRRVEPLDDAFPIASPCLLAESIKMILEHGVQTREQLQEALKLNPTDVENLCGIPPGYLDTRVIPFQPRPR